MVTSLTLPIHILSADTPPTLSLSSGDAFHGAVFIMSNTKPHYFTDIVFEPPGAIVTTCIIELKVSKGRLRKLGKNRQEMTQEIICSGTLLSYCSSMKPEQDSLRTFV